jgi:hypothetical protein
VLALGMSSEAQLHLGRLEAMAPPEGRPLAALVRARQLGREDEAREALRRLSDLAASPGAPPAMRTLHDVLTASEERASAAETELAGDQQTSQLGLFWVFRPGARAWVPSHDALVMLKALRLLGKDDAAGALRLLDGEVDAGRALCVDAAVMRHVLRSRH